MSSDITYYEGFYDLFNINDDEKKIEYSISLNSGENHKVSMSAKESVEEILEKDYESLRGFAITGGDGQQDDNVRTVPKMKINISFDEKLYANKKFMMVRWCWLSRMTKHVQNMRTMAGLYIFHLSAMLREACICEECLTIRNCTNRCFKCFVSMMRI